jgi:hypothetical protein
VSAAAVIPAPRVVGVITGPKAPVAGPASLALKSPSSTWGRGKVLPGLGAGEAEGTPGVGAKSDNPRRTTSGGGARLERARR